jgi:hypothetical protein
VLNVCESVLACQHKASAQGGLHEHLLHQGFLHRGTTASYQKGTFSRDLETAHICIGRIERKGFDCVYKQYVLLTFQLTVIPSIVPAENCFFVNL